MVFEVVGEISTPDGHVLMREIATQTHPSPKYIRIGEKVLHMVFYIIVVVGKRLEADT